MESVTNAGPMSMPREHSNFVYVAVRSIEPSKKQPIFGVLQPAEIIGYIASGKIRRTP
jgi:hypothetical protein